MSYSFEARFSPTEISFSEVLSRLETVLEQSHLHFEGEIMRLESRDGMPTAMSVDTIAVDTVKAIAQIARKWWGVALFCVSAPLLKEVGRTDAVEVTLNVFESPDGRRMLNYSEGKGAFAARVSSVDLERDLCALLVRVSAAMQIDVALYEEEQDEFRVVDLEEATRTIERVASVQGAPGICVAISQRLIRLEAARVLAGPRASRVKVSSSGYVVFPFLTDHN